MTHSNPINEKQDPIEVIDAHHLLRENQERSNKKKRSNKKDLLFW